MNTNATITLLGNNSGRNLGDAAIMSAILELVSKKIPNTKILVPSINPSFISNHYGDLYNVEPIDVRPRTFSLRLLGIPTFKALAKSDIALICDGIIFGRKLFSPHNFLITLIFLVPFAKLVGCKIVCFSCGIGPFPSKLSKIFAWWVIQLSDLVIMREHDSFNLAREIGVTKDIQVTGDAAFVNPISNEESAIKLMVDNKIDLAKPIIGLNITPYIDSWLKKDERVQNKKTFLKCYADAVNEALNIIEMNDGRRPQCVVFSCSPMDEAFSQELANLVSGVVIDNSRYLSHDIQALMRKCEFLIGMRFHSLVLASAAGAAIVGLVYAPKVKGYMRLLDCEDYCIELKDISNDDFGLTLAKAWKNRFEIRSKQQEVVNTLRAGAENAFDQLALMSFGKSS